MDNLSVVENGITFKGIEEKIYKTVCELSFRNTVKNIEILSNQSISYTAVWDITQKLGKIIKNQNLTKININMVN